MKIITFAAIKGGVGKTTLSYNFGEWLAKQDKHVLLVDADSQCSLSQTYGIYNTKQNIADIFESNNNRAQDLIIQQTPTLSILPGSVHLDSTEFSLETRTNKELIMYMWLWDNYDYLKKFDYVIIDCHPDFSIVTQNMIVVSDIVYSPIEPGQYSYNAKDMINARMDLFKKQLVDPKPSKDGKRESYVTAKLYFIGNRIKPNTKSSHDFVAEMNKDKQTAVLIPEKELLNKSTLFQEPLVNMQNDHKLVQKNKQFFKELFESFEKMAEL